MQLTEPPKLPKKKYPEPVIFTSHWFQHQLGDHPNILGHGCDILVDNNDHVHLVTYDKNRWCSCLHSWT